MPFWKSVGSALYWKATLVEILFRASVGILILRRSMNGQPRPAASCCRKISSEMPLSRQINSSSDSWEPLEAATRQALCQPSSLSGEARVAAANKLFIDTCDMRLLSQVNALQ